MNKLKYVVDNSTKDYLCLKLAEECAELSQLLIQQVTKPNGADKAARLDKLIEEVGDVKLGLLLVINKLKVGISVVERYSYKLDLACERVDKQLKESEVDFFVNEDEY